MRLDWLEGIFPLTNSGKHIDSKCSPPLIGLDGPRTSDAMLRSSFQRGLRPNQWTVTRCSPSFTHRLSVFPFQPVLSPLTRGRVRHSACATLLAECRTSVPGIESAKEVGGNKCAQRRRSSSHRFLLALRPRRSASLCISSLPIKQYSLKVRRCRGWEITW